MATIVKDLGPVTAYSDAVAGGYTGTREEWEALMASYASVAQTAIDAKDQAIQAKTAAQAAQGAAEAAQGSAETANTQAQTAAGTATTKAGEAAVSATSASGSATTATTKAGEAAQSAALADGSASSASQSATEAGAAKSGAEAAATRAEAAKDTAVAVEESIPADYSQLSNDVTDLKTALYEVREPKENLGYVTEFSGTKSAGGVNVQYVNNSRLKIYGTATTWVAINVFRGNSQVYAGSPTFTNNLSAGTYTIKHSDSLNVFYGTDWNSRTKWGNGETITLTESTCLFARNKSTSQDFGTSENPTYFDFELYQGNVSIIPTAVDIIARNELSEKIGDVTFNRTVAKADFDYDRPYNIFKGTTFTENKIVNYLDGSIVDDGVGRLVTDYMEIDPTMGYLCINIYVYLSGETGAGLITGGNRVWVHTAYAFYDKDKNFVASSSDNSASSKAIPANAKYVRLTINTASVIPYAVLFYGNLSGQQWVRYREYRKEIVEKSVFSDTGMESLKMVMFGDSITHGIVGLSSNGISYTDFANDYLRSNIINCGMGGTRMSQGSPTTIGLGSFASLCENIVSDDANSWDDLEAYAEANEVYWLPHIEALKNMDWNTVNAIGILYGANDWHNNVTVGTEYNEDPTKYDGACAYGLKLLLTKYPHLQVIIFTPFFRISGDTNSDTDNGAGLNMDDYGASLKHIQPVFHCPIVDSGNELGINRYTIYTYSATNDGTHPRKTIGLERLGRFLAESVKRYIQPY